MSQVKIGINMEFVRSADKSFEWGVAKAAELGYKYVEPMVHWGRELLSEAGYFHSVSMLEDPLIMKATLAKYKVKASGLSAHCPLARPEISVEYLKQAIRYAKEVGAPCVNTDEGPIPAWMSEKQAFAAMEYTLRTVAPMAERHGIVIGIEPHQIFSRYTKKLIAIADLAKSPNVQINYDSGNCYLGGKSDPYEMLDAVKGRLIHIHAKDISIEHSKAERGKVTGTPVGCACGDGIIDWARIIKVCKSLKTPKEIVLSVECGTVEQAKRSIAYLKKLL
ncbi:sugar phosphate isomerase/epimerase family protein [Kamptonema cortianum]|nr:sugar phosphate isomerase/epimerase family protein [Kamptonema cortianum]MDL5049755.1 sugar phosphate isomerase/epimerase family protein [Oscillatoria amoena NRMC-F 0135]